MVPYVKAYSDIFIKFLFSSPGTSDLLLDFLNSIRQKHGFPRLTAVQALNPYNLQQAIADKLSILDVKAKDDSGRQYNIEVQIASQPKFPERSLYYWSRLYASQLAEGDDYRLLAPAISVNIVGFTLFPGLPQAENCFLMTHKDDSLVVLTDHIVAHYLELPKLKLGEGLSPLDQWMLFLRYEGSGEVDMKLVTRNEPALEKAHRLYREFTADDVARLEAITREIAQFDQATRLRVAQEELKAAKEEARQEGIREGKREGMRAGIREGVLEVARAMKAEGLPPAQIAKFTGLTENDVSDL